MKTLKIIGIIFAVLFGINLFNVVTGVYSVYSDNPIRSVPGGTHSDNATAMEQMGYFKGNKDRVFTISYQQGVTPSAIQAYAKELPHTTGSMTSAYFYKKGSIIPNDGVTLAKSSISATNVIFDTKGLSSWQYVYMIYRTGQESFIDCNKDPTNDLCKK